MVLLERAMMELSSLIASVTLDCTSVTSFQLAFRQESVSDLHQLVGLLFLLENGRGGSIVIFAVGT